MKKTYIKRRSRDKNHTGRNSMGPVIEDKGKSCGTKKDEKKKKKKTYK